MPSIIELIRVPITTGGYVQDLAGLQRRSVPPSQRRTAQPLTPGFQSLREPARGLAVGLVLSNGRIYWGDCMGVDYPAVGGRDPVFRPETADAELTSSVQGLLVDRDPLQFQDLLEELDQVRIQTEEHRELPDRQPGDKISRRELFRSASRLGSDEPATEKIIVERGLQPAILYGVSQALLGAAADLQELTITELICRGWELPLPDQQIPLHFRCGDDHREGARELILQGAASLPGADLDDPTAQFGRGGLSLIRYARYLKDQIQRLGSPDYSPVIHLDLLGTPGTKLDHNPGKILGLFSALEQALQPFQLRLESPVLMPSQEEQIQLMAQLREYIQFRKFSLQLVADEWINSPGDVQAFITGGAADLIHIQMPALGGIHQTIHAARICRENNLPVLLGGSAAESSLSASISAQVGLALQPDLILAKPGFRADNSIIYNQMQRTMAELARTRKNQNSRT